MRKNSSPDSILKFLVASSIFGAFAAFVIVVLPPSSHTDFPLQKPLVGVIFAVICVSGTAAALSPAKCSAAPIFHRTRRSLIDKGKSSSTIGLVAHHPDCGRYSPHSVKIGGKRRCAACTGLIAGTLVAILVAVLYFFIDVGSAEITFPLAILGLIGFTLGFTQFEFKGWIRLVANAVFVVGSSSMLVAVDQHAASLSIDLYVIGLIILWVLTRVMISQWDHSRICFRCGYLCSK